MNWSAFFKVFVNILGTFAAGYGTAVATGQPPKVALGAGVIAAVTGQVGLHQEKPSA